MSGYQTVVVGTDGSDSSLRAVERAAQIAAGANAKLVVATAYFPHADDQRRYLPAFDDRFGQDAADHKHGSQLPSRLSPLSETEIHRIGGVWKDGIERVSPIDKFSAVSVLVDRPAVDRGREPGQSVDLLVKLRHTLVHYKPETQWDDKVRRVDKGLRSRIAPNPLMPPDTHPWYPNLLLSAACASWACETVTAFAGEWWSAMGFDYDYRVGIDYRDGIDG